MEGESSALMAGGLRLEDFHGEIRSRFPHLEQDAYGNKRLHLNCGAGTIWVDTALEAMKRAGEELNSLPGDVAASERATQDLHWKVRRLVADFLNGSRPEEVSFHFSTTNALFNLAVALEGVLSPEHNIIVTDLDHMANVNPWETVLGRWNGCEVRRAPISEDGRLDLDWLLSLVDGRTGLLAVTLASNALGTIVPLEKLVSLVRERAPHCLVCVDAVHHALHGPVDVRALGCDFLSLSGYKLFGPMLGVLWVKKSHLDRLKPYRLETNKDEAPFKFEQGTLNNQALAALGAALEYLAWIGERSSSPGDGAGRETRHLLRSAMEAVAAHDADLSLRFLTGIQGLDSARFRCYGLARPEEFRERDPTFLFEIEGLPASSIKKRLWEEHRIQVADGTHYSAAVVRHWKKSSICRASFAHYNTLKDVGVFLEALDGLVRGPERDVEV